MNISDGGGEARAEVGGLADGLVEALRAALERVSPEERAVFLLRRGFGLASTEVAPLAAASVDECRKMEDRVERHLHGSECSAV